MNVAKGGRWARARYAGLDQRVRRMRQSVVTTIQGSADRRCAEPVSHLVRPMDAPGLRAEGFHRSARGRSGHSAGMGKSTNLVARQSLASAKSGLDQVEFNLADDVLATFPGVRDDPDESQLVSSQKRTAPAHAVVLLRREKRSGKTSKASCGKRAPVALHPLLLSEGTDLAVTVTVAVAVWLQRTVERSPATL